MPRVQLALNVSDVGAAVDFYSKLFGAPPAKVRPGYANFAIEDPPLKLVLIEGEGQSGSINHLGVELDTAEELTAAQRRLESEHIALSAEEGVDCCYALQDKVWATGPDGTAWELYRVLADSEATPACCS